MVTLTTSSTTPLTLPLPRRIRLSAVQPRRRWLQSPHTVLQLRWLRQQQQQQPAVQHELQPAVDLLWVQPAAAVASVPPRVRRRQLLPPALEMRTEMSGLNLKSFLSCFQLRRRLTDSRLQPAARWRTRRGRLWRRWRWRESGWRLWGQRGPPATATTTAARRRSLQPASQLQLPTAAELQPAEPVRAEWR